jgi:type IV pilus assembly protein PilA
MLKKLGSKLKEQKGFTLIELLAVIVILGIIAAIAIPAISNVINKSEIKATAQEGVSIINAAKMYVAERPSGDFSTPLVHEDELEEYLDHVEFTNYSVTVEQDGTNGKFSYKITAGTVLVNLDAEVDAELTELTEQQLIDISNGTSVEDATTTTP